MLELFDFIIPASELYIYILVAAAVMCWLIAFNVVNPRNQFVAMVGDFLYRITEPVLRPIRNVLPNLGGIDISPVILILIILFIQLVVLPVLLRMLIYVQFRRATVASLSADGVTLAVRLTPKGGRDAIDGIEQLADGRSVLKVRVRAAASEGEANAALIKLIAKALRRCRRAMSFWWRAQPRGSSG